jgi:L-alanine-DL-glutamate epimerase-like enolase superfamily enzyme
MSVLVLSGLQIAVKDALKSVPTMLATAEHEYTRYGYKQLIDSGSVDLLQPDITWLGGITEARRVIAMAAANNIPVIEATQNKISRFHAFPLLEKRCVDQAIRYCTAVHLGP